MWRARSGRARGARSRRCVACPRPAPSDVARMVPVAYGVFAALVIMGVVLVVADLVAPVTI